MNKKNALPILLAIGIYLITAGLSYSFFAKKTTSAIDTTTTETVAVNSSNNYEALEFDQNKPKTQACPLNGALYSTDQEKWWKSHRPLGVMIENHVEARPQSGMTFADVVYEAVAEGGITRFLNVFYCQDAGIVGPVRSARTYFLDFISEYGKSPLYTHVGGANTPGPANALGQIEDYGWAGYNDINQFSVGFPTFKRDESRAGHPVATEHTMYSSTSKLWAVGAKRGLTQKDKDGDMWDETFVPYKFKDDAATSQRGSTSSIHVEYWEGYKQFFVDWKYDPTNNVYLRSNGGEPHNDRNTGKQLTAKTIVALFMDESNANDGYENNLHLLYKTKGTGKALIFLDGKQIKGTWKKDGRTGRTKITSSDGTEISFNRGKLWFHILPTEGIVQAK